MRCDRCGRHYDMYFNRPNTVNLYVDDFYDVIHNGQDRELLSPEISSDLCPECSAEVAEFILVKSSGWNTGLPEKTGVFLCTVKEPHFNHRFVQILTFDSDINGWLDTEVNVIPNERVVAWKTIAPVFFEDED